MAQPFDVGPYDDSKVPSNEQLNSFYNESVKPKNSERNQVIEALNDDMGSIFGFVHHSDSRFSKTDVIRLGSAYQGLKVGHADEFDFTLCLNYISIDDAWHFVYGPTPRYYGFDRRPDIGPNDEVWKKAHTSSRKLPDEKYTNIHTTVDKSRKVVRTSVSLESPGVGYVTIQLDGDLLKKFSNTFDLTFTGTKFDCGSAHLIPFLVKQELKELLENALDHKSKLEFNGTFTLSQGAHGPALTLKYEHPGKRINFKISIDISPAVRCTWSFEKLGVNWPRSHSAWPSQETAQLIKSKGVIYVAKHNFFWRLSFAECEKALCKSEDCGKGCRKKVHRIMKYIRKKLWNTRANPLISSYIVKNVWLWEMEKFAADKDWDESLLRDRLFGCIRSLINYVRNYINPHIINASLVSLPQYFDTRHNLLEDKDKVQLAEECDAIEQFYKNPKLPK